MASKSGAAEQAARETRCVVRASARRWSRRRVGVSAFALLGAIGCGSSASEATPAPVAAPETVPVAAPGAVTSASGATTAAPIAPRGPGAIDVLVVAPGTVIETFPARAERRSSSLVSVVFEHPDPEIRARLERHVSASMARRDTGRDVVCTPHLAHARLVSTHCVVGRAGAEAYYALSLAVDERGGVREVDVREALTPGTTAALLDALGARCRADAAAGAAFHADDCLVIPPTFPGDRVVFGERGLVLRVFHGAAGSDVVIPYDEVSDAVRADGPLGPVLVGSTTRTLDVSEDVRRAHMDAGECAVAFAFGAPMPRDAAMRAFALVPTDLRASTGLAAAPGGLFRFTHRACDAGDLAAREAAARARAGGAAVDLVIDHERPALASSMAGAGGALRAAPDPDSALVARVPEGTFGVVFLGEVDDAYSEAGAGRWVYAVTDEASGWARSNVFPTF